MNIEIDGCRKRKKYVENEGGAYPSRFFILSIIKVDSWRIKQKMR